MILIQSASDDFSTSMVLQWLSHLKKDFLRLNDKCKIEGVTISENSFTLKLNSENIYLYEFKSYWYRRGHFEIKTHLDSDNADLKGKIENYNKYEASIVLKSLYSFLQSNIRNIGNFQTSQINKIEACEIAHKNGFDTPNFLITNSKIELQKFHAKYKKIITKSIYGLPGFNIKEKHYNAKTVMVSSEDIESASDTFGLSLFQEYIEKQIELRVFFLYDSFYASAIFSQNDTQTKIDFRNYNRNKPNRVIPFNLPAEVIEKLNKVNLELSLNTGSYDLILTPDGKYYFLEVNPIGQFAQVSFPCNYYLEKQIAKKLSNG